MSNKLAVKIIAFMKKKPGLTHEEFIKYYEENHTKLVLSVSPQIVDYRRNYVKPSSASAKMHSGEVDYDVITEAWFATKEDFNAWAAAGSNEEISAAIIKDELNFIDRSSVRMFVVDERSSVI